MKKPLLIFIIALGLVLGSAVGFVGFLSFEFFKTPPSNEAKEVIYEVIPNKGFNIIAKELELKGVIKNATFFTAYARVTGGRAKIKVGEYGLSTNMLPHEVLSIITSGKSIERPFTVSEGLNIYEIAENYEAQGFGKKTDFLTICKDPEFVKKMTGENLPSLEGYLFPETYQITKFTDAKALITSMVHRFNLIYSDIEKQKLPTQLNKREVITLASIIEKETGAPEERPLISSVFHNRIKKNMRLQTDPTIIYGIADVTGAIPTKIHKTDITAPTKYNTYVINGLPPGPIANPSKEAILAALKPQESNYLYFVSHNDGRHQFSESYEAHSKAVQKYQLDPKAREGKSWRDLNKTKTN